MTSEKPLNPSFLRKLRTRRRSDVTNILPLQPRPDFFLRFIRNGVDLLSYNSQTIDKREHCDWMAEKIGLDHMRPLLSGPSSRIALVYQSFFSRTIADRL